MIPQLHISTDLRYGYLRIISGAMYNSVPHLSYDNLHSDWRLNPKSINLICIFYSTIILSNCSARDTWLNISMSDVQVV